MVSPIDDAFWEHASAMTEAAGRVLETSELGERIRSGQSALGPCESASRRWPPVLRSRPAAKRRSNSMAKTSGGPELWARPSVHGDASTALSHWNSPSTSSGVSTVRAT